MGNPAPHRARKRFGQHFLHDNNVITRILDSIDPKPEDNMLEIGPGRGALTLPLLRRCEQLTAVELDRDLVPLLQRRAGQDGKLTVINADILKFDLKSLANSERLRVIGNLPYNISTPLMFHLLDSVHQIHDMHFMVQKEVARRIVAEAGSREYGRLSVMMQYYCHCQYLFEVEPASFKPPPKVDSAIIRLTPHTSPIVVSDFTLFSDIVKTAFSQRRKSVSNSLKPLLPAEMLDACQIDRRLRAENLTLPDFARLANMASTGPALPETTDE